MKREWQVRIEYEADNEEIVYNYDSLKEAEEGYREHITRVRDEHNADDVHVELIEVLEQTRVDGERNFSDDL